MKKNSDSTAAIPGAYVSVVMPGRPAPIAPAESPSDRTASDPTMKRIVLSLRTDSPESK